MTHKFCLVFLLLLSCISCQDACQELVQKWIEGSQAISPVVYTDSGKFLNDLGDYQNCKAHSDEYVYFTMTVINLLVKGRQNMGLCAPLECEQSLEQNTYAEDVQKTLNDAFKNATNSTIAPFVKLEFYNPDKVAPKMDWSNYTTIVFLALLIGLGIAGSLIHRCTKKNTLPVKVIKCFSIYDNVKKIFTISRAVQNENLLFLNGMRVLSIFWIIFGHDTWFNFMFIKNWTETLDILTRPGLGTLAPAAYFAVDTFFWIGGFLITMGMLEQLKKVKSFGKFYIGAIIHRFIRIWPTYMVAILIFWKVVPFLHTGPIWSLYSMQVANCENGGVLWNMFFIDNFEYHGPIGVDYCFGWGWYLAVDFQLFVITPFIFYAYHRSKKIGIFVTLCLLVGSVLTAFIMILVNDWRYPIPNPKFAPQPEFMDDFYYKPYIRASAYLMGILSGYFYVEWKNHNPAITRIVNYIKNSITIRCLFYVLGIGICEAVIWIIIPYQTGESTWSSLQQALYNSLNRIFFLIGVYMLVFAAMFGCKNDPSRHILGHWVFSPLAKVSFCIYLTHFIVIMTSTFSNRTNLYWQESTSLYTTMADIFYSILLATMLSVMVEAPILGLEKIFLRPPKKDKGELDDKQLIDVKAEGKKERDWSSDRRVKSMTDTTVRSSKRAEHDDISVRGQRLESPLMEGVHRSPLNSPEHRASKQPQDFPQKQENMIL